MLADFQDLVAQAVRDDSGVISETDIVAAIGLAVTRYSLDRPRTVVEDLPASGTNYMPLPSLWDDSFSIVSSAEYPIGEFPPIQLDNDEFAIYQAPTGKSLRFLFVPTSDVRVSYGIAHVVNATVDTIPYSHREAVTCWAAAYLYDQLAGWFSGANDSTIQADKVDRGNQAKDFAQRAATLRKRYINELGLEDKKSAAAGVVVDLDLKSSLGQDRFTHPNRRRF